MMTETAGMPEFIAADGVTQEGFVGLCPGLRRLRRAAVLAPMHPQLRNALVVLAAGVLAVWVGISLAQEKHFIASVAALVSVWAVLAWTRGPLAEAWLLGFLVFGYVIGNRGFAQITPIAGLPLFLSELGLAVAVALVLLRGAQSRFLPVQSDWLNGLLLLWLALGGSRILWDVRQHGFMALRDFATVYYVLYFFAAQALARHAASHRLLRTTFLVTFAVLPIPGLLSHLFPDFFLHNLLVSGVPLIFYKGDLMSTFLFISFLLLLPGERFTWRGLIPGRWLLALISLVFGLLLLSRASMVGLLVACGLIACSGRWRPLGVIATVCATGLLAVFVVSFLQKKDFRDTRAYAIYEAAASIADFSGTRDYQSDDSGNKGDNNRFRLVWWRNVAVETATTSPLFGLGFGADLAAGFVREYYPDSNDDFSARSPHNIFLTAFGRMGAAGVLVLLAVYTTLFFSTLRTARAARSDPTRQSALTLQAACWVVLISACFGVVLEGPMGAIPFWILLGLAHHEATRSSESPNAPLPASAAAL
ncbi:O-antigen ligase domain-containing protein [Oleiharenicola lentus]|uniref:O-antigen ligase domain-containing protein n=1 Tax=Oleiharenicola lentus TaxID=2508720 RepID=A0A4Q1C7Z6_9BACT|nr:O-antigen ligase family protein [Oleiharenicola lentus]RXK54998.1 O-antigen ligase domain-containing protein [Oleiharenicola lentus]